MTIVSLGSSDIPDHKQTHTAYIINSSRPTEREGRGLYKKKMKTQKEKEMKKEKKEEKKKKKKKKKNLHRTRSIV